MNHSNPPNDPPFVFHDCSHYPQGENTSQSEDGMAESRNLPTQQEPHTTDIKCALSSNNQPNYYCLSLVPNTRSGSSEASSLGAPSQGASYYETSLPPGAESPEYLAHRLLVEFGKTRTNYNSLVPRIVEVMRLYRDFGAARCPVPVVSNLEELLNDEALNRIEHRYPNSLDAGFLVLCTERRALRSGGGGKYYFIDTSGRLVGCHKSDLPSYAEKRVLCGPVLLKNLIFVFIMRGTFGLDSRCKSSNPQRLLEYYEGLAKEGKAMDVQRLVRVWSMEIFPETPYDGGFPHCSLLWVKRMHVGAHLIKWKRSQWHTSQLRVHDLYSTSYPPSTKRSPSQRSQQVSVDPGYQDFYQPQPALQKEIPNEFFSLGLTQKDLSEGCTYETCDVSQAYPSKKRRTHAYSSSPFLGGIQQLHSQFTPLSSRQEPPRNYESYNRTLLPKYSAGHGDFYLPPYEPEGKYEMLPTLLKAPPQPSELSSETPEPCYPFRMDSSTFEDGRSELTEESWSIKQRYSADIYNSMGETPRMPTILTSDMSAEGKYGLLETSTNTILQSDFEEGPSADSETIKNSVFDDSQPSAFFSDAANVQAVYANFDHYFGSATMSDLNEWCSQVLKNLRKTILVAGAQLLKSHIALDATSTESLHETLRAKIGESKNQENVRACLKILLACLIQQHRLGPLLPTHSNVNKETEQPESASFDHPSQSGDPAADVLDDGAQNQSSGMTSAPPAMSSPAESYSSTCWQVSDEKWGAQRSTLDHTTVDGSFRPPNIPGIPSKSFHADQISSGNVYSDFSSPCYMSSTPYPLRAKSHPPHFADFSHSIPHVTSEQNQRASFYETPHARRNLPSSHDNSADQSFAPSFSASELSHYSTESLSPRFPSRQALGALELPGTDSSKQMSQPLPSHQSPSLTLKSSSRQAHTILLEQMNSYTNYTESTAEGGKYSNSYYYGPSSSSSVASSLIEAKFSYQQPDSADPQVCHDVDVRQSQVSCTPPPPLPSSNLRKPQQHRMDPRLYME